MATALANYVRARRSITVGDYIRIVRTFRVRLSTVEAGTGMRRDDSRPILRGVVGPSVRSLGLGKSPGATRACTGQAVRELARLSSPDIRGPKNRTG